MGLSPEDSQHVVDSVALSWPYVALALLGGLARACRFGVHSVKQFIGGLLCSGVSGLLCILALYDQDVPPLFAGAIVGMVGYSGGSVLDAVIGILLRRIRRVRV